MARCVIVDVFQWWWRIHRHSSSNRKKGEEWNRLAIIFFKMLQAKDMKHNKTYFLIRSEMDFSFPSSTEKYIYETTLFTFSLTISLSLLPSLYHRYIRQLRDWKFAEIILTYFRWARSMNCTHTEKKNRREIFKSQLGSKQH